MSAARKQQYLLYFTLFQVMLGFGAVIPIMPHFARDLGANSIQMGLLITVWAGAQFMLSPVWGALSDRIGRRPVLLIGVSGYALTFLMSAFSPNIWVLMLARFLGGVLSAATIPTAQAYVADTSSGEERTSRMASMGAAMSLGFICGPAVGGLLSPLGFRGTFLAAGGLAVVNWILAVLMLPEPSQRTQRAVRKGISGLKAVSIALAGPEALLFILAFVATYGGSAMFSMLGYFMADRLGAGPELLAVAFTVQGLAAVGVQSVLVGYMVRRFGSERTASLALLVGVFGFAALSASQTLVQLLLALVVVTFGFSTLRPLVSALVSQRTRLEQGMTMGIQTAFDALGRTISPMVAGAAYLWLDWGPFLSGAIMYAIFFVITWVAWRRPPMMAQASD